MLALRGQDCEVLAVANVLQIGSTELLATSASRFRHVDAVFLDELAVDGLGIFVSWDVTGHIEPISVSQVAAGNLLDESFQ